MPVVVWTCWLFWPATRSWRLRLEDADLAAALAQASRDRQRFGVWRVAVTSGAVPRFVPRRRTQLAKVRVDALPNGDAIVPAALPSRKVRVSPGAI